MLFRKILSISTLPLFLLGGCAFMPSTGPHASLILDKNTNSIPVEEVNEDIASQLWNEAIARQEDELSNVLADLKKPNITAITIASGDTLDLSLWVASGQSDIVLGNVPQARNMGRYTVSHLGTVDLPYVGQVYVKNLTLHDAEKVIAERYSRTQLFPQAEAAIHIEENKAQNVVVMGAVNAPTVINWSEGGIDISEAIARAGGFKVFDPSKQGSDLGVNNVVIIRHGKSFNVPMKTALSQDIPLQSGDRLVLQHTPIVRALCLGAGWKSPTMVPFDETPSLADVLAGAGDMSPNAAQGRSIFVFKHALRMIYRINFDKTEGMKAAQTFPISDKDLVYIPPARSVTLQQAVNIIMSVGYPAAMGAAIK